MKTIKQIQDTNVRELYQLISRNRGTQPDIDDINALSSEINMRNTRLPLSGNYRPEGYSKLDSTKFNTEIGLMYCDANTMNQFLVEYMNRLREMAFVFKTWKDHTIEKLNRINNEALKYIVGKDFSYRTKLIDMNKDCNPAITNAVISGSGTVSMKQSVSATTLPGLSSNNITIDKIGDGGTATILGQPIDIFNQFTPDQLVLVIDGKNTNEAGFEIKAVFDPVEMNSITVKNGTDYHGLKLKVSISKDRTSFNTIYNGIINKPDIDINFTAILVSCIKVEITRSVPNISSASDIRYEFVINSISCYTKASTDSNIYRTNQIDIDQDVSSVRLMVDYDVIGDTDVTFTMSTSKDSTGVPTGFTTFVPGEDSAFVKYGHIKHQIDVVPIDNKWDIKPEVTYGLRLYNVLSNISDIDSDSFEVTSGILTPKDDKSIGVDSVKLYRGIGDYVLKSNPVGISRNVDPMIIHPMIDRKSGWYTPVPILVKTKLLISDSMISGTNRNIIDIPYTIKSMGDVSIEREDEVIVDNLINSKIVSNNSTTITYTATSEMLDRSYHYYIYATVPMSEYIIRTGNDVSILPELMDVSINGEVIRYGIDYIIDYDLYTIKIAKTTITTNYKPQIPFGYEEGEIEDTNISIEMKYTYNEVRKDKSHYYETYAYTVSPARIRIFPFTGYEISAGNYHTINGEDVSVSSSYTLNPGWNIIQTTHPHRSVNEYDINKYTLTMSSAGIIIPETITLRPYLDSMRCVSPFILMTMEPEEAAKCFAFENGKILVSFRPDSINSGILSLPDYSWITGKTVMCKYPVYNSSDINLSYVPRNERFMVEFIQPGNIQNKFVVLNIEMKSNSPDAAVTINKLGYNEYKETDIV